MIMANKVSMLGDSNKIRIRVYSRRFIRTFMGGLTKNCCFMHPPKSAGKSLQNALSACCPLNKSVAIINPKATRQAAAIYSGSDEKEIRGEMPVSGPLFDFREHLLLYYCARGFPLVAGHFLFSERAYHAYKGTYVFVSLVRDPVARLVSNYVSDSSRKITTLDFDEYLQSDLAWGHSSVLVRYFSGTSPISKEDAPNYLGSAKANMDKFDIVGIVEEIDTFIGALSEMLGVRISLPHDNKTVSPKPTVSDAALKRVKDLCSVDREIYTYAQEKFRHMVKE